MDEMKIDDGGGRQRRVPVDYPANSKRSQQKNIPPPKDVNKIVEGEVKLRKKGWRDKFGGAFLSEDSGTVVNYVVMEVLVPAAKNMISDSISQGIERILFGDSKPRSQSRSGHTNYSTYSDRYKTRDENRREMSRRSRATHDFSDVILESRGEAEDVLDGLRNLISQYEVATVNELYDLVGLTGEFTDDKWGWYDLRSASVRAIRGGYLLNLPRTQPIT
jgi:hypothetical protein